MKIGVIFFHRNILNIYKKAWIQKSVNSMLSQSFNDFSIYEINYGGDYYSVLSDTNHNKQNLFFSENFDNHVYAMNFILDKAFSDGCDFVFNTNLDDFYHPDRIEKQIKKLEEGYDIVSSDFCYIEEINGEDVITFNKNIKSDTGIKFNLNWNHNVIAHPVVAYSKRFWDGNKYLPQEIPLEDLSLWKRSINSGYKFYIMDDVLLFYRLHGNQVTGGKNW